jgi:putative ABC transport system permease protein
MAFLREWIRRVWGTLGRGRCDDDLEMELRLHEEMEAEQARQTGGNAARGARLRTGNPTAAMDALRDQRGVPRLDALAADVVFGWRQLLRHRTATIVAIVSLGLAIGATTAAFRLVDAVLIRPLPVHEPDRLFAVATTTLGSEPGYDDVFDYPTYRAYTQAVGDRAALMVVGMTARMSVALGTGDEPVPAFRQYVSGNVFGSLGLTPVVGRLLGPDDDRVPGGHPVVVVSHDFWSRRFARDPAIVGSTIRLGSRPYEIVGVAPKGFTGTEPGMITDLFVPAVMNAQALDSPGWAWFRIWVRPRPGVAPEEVREVLQASYTADVRQRLTKLPADTPKERIDAYLSQQVRMLAAGAGVSPTQRTFRRPLLILAGLALLVLLAACANVANLMSARAVARAREMSLRVSLGASRGRLLQLVLIEGALLAVAASAVGALFATWSAPLIVSMLASTDRPVRLVLDADWRILTFGVAVTCTVTLLLGLAPAFRASAVKPIGSLKETDPRVDRRLTNTLMGAQMAFCAFLVFVAGLFVATFDRLVSRPLGFAYDRLLLMEVAAPAELSLEAWNQVAERLRQTPGVESVSLAGWVPLSGNRWTSSVRLPGEASPVDGPHVVETAPRYFQTMQIGVIDGRDFRAGDVQPRIDERKQPVAGVGIVNEAFARKYFEGRNPIGRYVLMRQTKDVETPMEIVGLVGDAVYFSVREAVPPTVYVPMDGRSGASLVVRTAAAPTALAATLRRGVVTARADLRVRSVEPQAGLVRQQMLRERLLAVLSSFFALVALAVAAIGLYGVMNYAVVRQRREIGIRMALGARAGHVIRQVVTRTLALVCVGTLVGFGAAVAFGRAVRALLFQVSATDQSAMIVPLAALAVAAACAALPPVIRATRIDPAQTLRTE